jgi:hypothetical protein
MHANLTLNIGLAVGNLGQSNTLAQNVDTLERAGFLIDALSVQQSDTEATAVARVKFFGHGLVDKVYALATTLGQDCIAVYSNDLEFGKVIGPSPWGDFNPDLFLTLDGRRLSDVLAS